MTDDTIAARLAAHRAWLAGAGDGRLVEHGDGLVHADLRGVILVDADLRDADLGGADLWSAKLEGADLRGTRFSDDVGVWQLGLLGSRRDQLVVIAWESGHTEVRMGRFHGTLAGLATAAAQTHAGEEGARLRGEYERAVAYVRADAAARWPGWTEGGADDGE